MLEARLRSLMKAMLRRVVHLTRTAPRGLVRVGSCFFEVFPESRPLVIAGYYEHEEREAIRRFVPPDLPVVELGGSQGIVACITNRFLKNKKLHVVVEANSSVLPLLTRNRDRNRCEFEIVQAAAGIPRETVRFFPDENPLKSSALVEGSHYNDVSCISLNEIVHRRGFHGCTLICDIEGAEIGLIEAEIDVLCDRFKLLIVEFHPGISGVDTVRRTLNLLINRKFEVIWSKRHVSVLRKMAVA